MFLFSREIWHCDMNFILFPKKKKAEIKEMMVFEVSFWKEI
jgi:hypothetical protein